MEQSKVTNTETFIARAMEVHGDKFDYSKVDYVKSSEKVIIICSKHGEFLQTPNNHLVGYGCNKCSREESGRLRSFTIDGFLQKAKDKFRNKYKYYIPCNDNDFRSNTIIDIECPEHDISKNQAYLHLQSNNGCPKCGTISTSLKTTKSFEHFVLDANRVHNDKYDYSKVVWINAKTKVKVICPIHGEFMVTPSVHTSHKSGCRECGNETIGNALRSSLEDFLIKARNTHGDTYNYDKVIYIGCDNKVIITCNYHGDFAQTPYTHYKQKQGCPMCAKEKSRIPILERYKDTPTIFYSFKYKNKYKIGITIFDAIQRYKGEFPLEEMEELVEYKFDTFEQAYMFEQFMLTNYYEHRYRGRKIFKKTGNSEVFKIDILKMYLDEFGGDIGTI